MTKYISKIWIKPMWYSYGRKGKGKEYFTIITDTDDKDTIDETIGENIQEILDLCECEINENWGISKTIKTSEGEIGDIQYISKETILKEKEEKKKIKDQKNEIKNIENTIDIFEEGYKQLESDNWRIKDGDVIIGKDIKVPILKLWKTFSEIDINEGDTATLENGVVKLTGGSFLSVGLADVQINNQDGNQVAGAYLRKSGKIDIGDVERTRMVSIDLKQILEIRKHNLINGIESNDILKIKDSE